MGFTCCVPGCYNRSVKGNSEITFHRFPENKNLRKQWICNISRKGQGNKLFTPDTNSHRVCAEHFVGGKKSKKHPTPTLFPLKKLLTATKPRSTRNSSKQRGRPTDSHMPANQHEELMQHQYIEPMLCQERESLLPDCNRFKIPPVDNEVTVVTSKDTLNTWTYKPGDMVLEHSYARCIDQRPTETPTKARLSAEKNLLFSDLFSTMKRLHTAQASVKSLKSRTLDISTIKECSETLNLYTGFKKRKHWDALYLFLHPDFASLEFPGGDRHKVPEHTISDENCLLLTILKYRMDTPQADLAFRFVP